MYTRFIIEGFIMYSSTQAREAIIKKVQAFTGIDKNFIQWANQDKFKPPKDKAWCRITIQYSDSVTSGLHFGLLERDYGIISIQCFDYKGAGDDRLIALADAWREHFKGWTHEYLQVMKTNAPTPIYNELDSNYYSTLLRVEFRVN